ncbi:MAG: MBL fold metallo-hydrolase [Micromonosporaceae bacterium]|nr:MBL fold metallo-hydrolase [Micromonosporaceae bacterium]
MIITHIGGPTALIELDGWRLLTDPTFDPPGQRYHFGWGTSSVKLTGPAVAIDDLPPIDAVLLTHDHHGDNLDAAGRAMLSRATIVLTTVRGARRLGLRSARGLAAGDVTQLAAPGKPDLAVTATPARHGPPLSRPIVGDVIGFAVHRPGKRTVLLWVTGDTVLYRGLRRAAAEMDVDVALVHVGGVRFPISGPVRYTMTGRAAVELVAAVRPRVAVPVHYEGWSHFADGRAAVERALAAAPDDVRRRVCWLPIGTPQTV